MVEVSDLATSVLLFDLGGVLVENAGILRNLKVLLGQAPGAMAVDGDEVMKERWLRSPAAREFELGRVPPEVFARRFLVEWGSKLDPEVFLGDLVDWLGEPYPGSIGLLAQLRGRHHVSCLSNCNELHWNRLSDFLTNFESAFSSHLLGEIKPDPEIFRTVMGALQVAPGQVRFFDDSRSNVEAARGLGIRAFRTVGFTQLLECLKGEGLL